MGSVGQSSTFSEHGHVAYQIKENHKCSNMVANILPADPQTLGMRSVGQNSTFSGHGHVAYQIKDNHECFNIVSNILPTDPPPLGWGQKVKIQLYQNMVLLHIKLKGIMNAVTL